MPSATASGGHVSREAVRHPTRLTVDLPQIIRRERCRWRDVPAVRVVGESRHVCALMNIDFWRAMSPRSVSVSWTQVLANPFRRWIARPSLFWEDPSSAGRYFVSGIAQGDHRSASDVCSCLAAGRPTTATTGAVGVICGRVHGLSWTWVRCLPFPQARARDARRVRSVPRTGMSQPFHVKHRRCTPYRARGPL